MLEPKPAVKRRKRLSLVCENCKRKKIRCDKGQPCTQCIKAKITDSCSYSTTLAPNGDAHGLAPVPAYVVSAKRPITFDTKSEQPTPTQPQPSQPTQPQKSPPIPSFRPPPVPAPAANPTGYPRPDENVTISKRELELLKTRLLQIEGTIQASPPAPSPPKYPSSQASLARDFKPLPEVFERNELPRAWASSKSYVGLNPCNPGDTINFFEGYTSINVKDPNRRINHGPFAWLSLMKRDEGLGLLWNYVIKLRDDNVLGTALVFSQNETNDQLEVVKIMATDSNHTEQAFKKRAFKTEGYEETVPYKAILHARKEKALQTHKVNETALPLGLTFFDGQIDRELQLVDKIKMVLPTKKSVMLLVDRYFTWFYPYSPFIDQDSFTSDVTRILGPFSHEEVPITEIVVEKKLDLAILGLLLIVLRLAYLSFFSNKTSVNLGNLKSESNSPEAQKIKYLLLNPINMNTIDVAQECLDLFELMRKPTFTVLQLAFYMRIYHTYAPEDGDGADGGDSHVLSAMLIQMAYALGLNREPDKFADACNDPKQNHLGRKIWHFLTLSDLFLSYTFGNPMTVNRLYYDTRLPFHEPGNENLRDAELDKHVTENYFLCAFIDGWLRDILSLCLNVGGRTNMVELCDLLTRFELTLHDKFGLLEEITQPPEKSESRITFDRNVKIKFYLLLKTFFISIYFHFLLHYKNRDIELLYFYCRKVLLIAVQDIMPHYFDLLGNSEVVCDMIINPSLELTIHKSNQIILASLVKINFQIYHMTQNPEHDNRRLADRLYCYYFRLLCQYSSCLTRCAEVLILAISKISNRYYYAWRITKGHTFLLKTVTSVKFYQENYEALNDLKIPLLTSKQLEELISICEKTLKKFGKADLASSEFFSLFPSEDPRKANPEKYPEAPAPLPEMYPPMSYPTNASSTTGELLGTSDTPVLSIDVDFSKSNIDNMFGFDNVNNEEIDRLWLNIITMKQDSKFDIGTNDFDFHRNSPANPPTPLFTQTGYPSYAPDQSPGPGRPFNAELTSKFDIFSDVPFDQVFKID